MFFSALETPSNIFKVRQVKRAERLSSWLFSHVPNNLTYINLAYKASWAFALLSLCTAFIAPLFLVLTFSGLVGCYYLNKVNRFLQEAHQKRNFLTLTQKISFPERGHPIEKTDFASFNHVFSFRVQDNIVWYALRENREKPAHWQRLFIYDLHGKPIKSIRADGENLMVRVAEKNGNDTIFYKKVVKESRDKQGMLTLAEIVSQPKSIHSWFTLPVLRYLFPQHYAKRLTIPANHQWAMSHSGKFKKITTDKRKQEHINWGVTTVYEFDGTHFVLHDPYLPPHLVIKIPLPIGFTLINFDASASTLAIWGKNHAGQPMLYTRKLDYDQLGLHPLIRYGYQVDLHKKARVLPMSCWKAHLLPDKMTSLYYVNISQTGIGDGALELKLFSHSEQTIYFKNLKEKQFQPQSRDNLSLEKLVIPTSNNNKSLTYYHLESTISTELNSLFSSNYIKLTVPTFHFDEVNVKAYAHKENGEINKLYCIRRSSFIKSALGFKQTYWHLVQDGQVVMNFILDEHQLIQADQTSIVVEDKQTNPPRLLSFIYQPYVKNDSNSSFESNYHDVVTKSLQLS